MNDTAMKQRLIVLAALLTGGTLVHLHHRQIERRNAADERIIQRVKKARLDVKSPPCHVKDDGTVELHLVKNEESPSSDEGLNQS